MATKLYSLAEVAQHNDNKKTWIVVHNGVYDVTEFLNEHPGGEEVLLEQAGKDATEPFEDVGHSSDARELMAKYKVGELIESERKKVKEPVAKDWSADNNSEDSSSWKSWLIPVSLDIDIHAQARDRMYEMLDSIIARRRSGQEFQQDFLESLIMKHSKGGAEGEDDENKLTDKQLKDNVLTLLVAGHDTTTAALTWLIKFLEENPHVLEQLREEHRGIIANRKSGTDLTWSEVNNMPYTAKVISETLRRATILPWYSRKASQDFEVDGYKIKKGWSVNLDVVSIHHDPEVFPDPQNFDPSRFDDPLRPFSFLGFGSGPRMCPGMNLAKIEICVFIHHLVTRYKWKPLDRDDSVQPTLVRMPKNKYPVLVEPL